MTILPACLDKETSTSEKNHIYSQCTFNRLKLNSLTIIMLCKMLGIIPLQGKVGSIMSINMTIGRIRMPPADMQTANIEKNSSSTKIKFPAYFFLSKKIL